MAKGIALILSGGAKGPWVGASTAASADPLVQPWHKGVRTGIIRAPLMQMDRGHALTHASIPTYTYLHACMRTHTYIEYYIYIYNYVYVYCIYTYVHVL